MRAPAPPASPAVERGIAEALAGRIARAGHGADQQGGVARGRHRLPRPHRTARRARRGGRVRDDAGQRRAARGAGQHPRAAGRGGAAGDAGGRAVARSGWPTRRCRRFGIARPRVAVAGLNPHAGEDGLFGARGRRRHRPGGRGGAGGGHRRQRPLAGRHGVQRARAGRVRRRGGAVPRPGADPGEVSRARPGRERDARPALRPHQPRPRHRLRHRRHRAGAVRPACARRCAWRRRWRRPEPRRRVSRRRTGTAARPPRPRRPGG